MRCNNIWKETPYPIKFCSTTAAYRRVALIQLAWQSHESVPSRHVAIVAKNPRSEQFSHVCMAVGQNVPYHNTNIIMGKLLTFIKSAIDQANLKLWCDDYMGQ